ncbi:MAG: peptidylprolyl isomerase [Verrucomicrobiota bacterium]
MEIAEGTVVAMDYALRDDEGTLIDQSNPDNPLIYLHGHRNIIPGLESALTGKSVGESVDVRISPEEGYGNFDPALEQVVPRQRFQGVEDLKVGMQFQASTDHGPVSVSVTKIEDDNITVDGNHPLAGKHLNFAVTIQDIRAASEEEIAQGHIHQAGGCCGGGGGEGGCCQEEPKQQSDDGCGDEGCGCGH